MNGKKARALRHLNTGTLNIRDVAILSQAMKDEEKRIQCRSKLPKDRVRPFKRPISLDRDIAFERQQIVIRPLRALKNILVQEHNTIGNKLGVGSFREAANLPKHLLDRAASC